MQPFTCSRCLATNYPLVGYVAHDGDILACFRCGTRFVVHLCNHNHGLSGLESAIQTELLEVIEGAVVSAVTKACPPCEVWYKVGDIVEKVDPQAGMTIKKLAIGAGLAVLAIAAIQSLSDSD